MSNEKELVEITKDNDPYTTEDLSFPERQRRFKRAFEGGHADLLQSNVMSDFGKMLRTVELVVMTGKLNETDKFLNEDQMHQLSATANVLQWVMGAPISTIEQLSEQLSKILAERGYWIDSPEKVMAEYRESISPGSHIIPFALLANTVGEWFEKDNENIAPMGPGAVILNELYGETFLNYEQLVAAMHKNLEWAESFFEITQGDGIENDKADKALIIKNSAPFIKQCATAITIMGRLKALKLELGRIPTEKESEPVLNGLEKIDTRIVEDKIMSLGVWLGAGESYAIDGKYVPVVNIKVAEDTCDCENCVARRNEFGPGKGPRRNPFDEIAQSLGIDIRQGRAEVMETPFDSQRKSKFQA